MNAETITLSLIWIDSKLAIKRRRRWRWMKMRLVRMLSGIAGGGA